MQSSARHVVVCLVFVITLLLCWASIQERAAPIVPQNSLADNARQTKISSLAVEDSRVSVERNDRALHNVPSASAEALTPRRRSNTHRHSNLASSQKGEHEHVTQPLSDAVYVAQVAAKTGKVTMYNRSEAFAERKVCQSMLLQLCTATVHPTT